MADYFICFKCCYLYGYVSGAEEKIWQGVKKLMCYSMLRIQQPLGYKHSTLFFPSSIISQSLFRCSFTCLKIMFVSISMRILKFLENPHSNWNLNEHKRLELMQKWHHIPLWDIFNKGGRVDWLAGGVWRSWNLVVGWRRKNEYVQYCTVTFLASYWDCNLSIFYPVSKSGLSLYCRKAIKCGHSFSTHISRAFLAPPRCICAYT